MKKKVLITDTWFIYDKHVKQLEDAGFEVERLDKPAATERELKDAIKGKTGYILGGSERVTKAVIDAADLLEGIVFTGTGYKGFIPAWEYALQKGIVIENAPHANAFEVAEWALASIMAMGRHLFALGPQGDSDFITSKSITQLDFGIIGLGHIGSDVAEMVSKLGAKRVCYWSREDKKSKYKYFENINDLLKNVDVAVLCVSDDAGEDFIDKDNLKYMKNGSLLVSISHSGIINEKDMFSLLSNNKIRAACDVVADKDMFKNLSPDIWYVSSKSAAGNVESANNRVSDIATEKIIKILNN